jgi:hypothetical protein
MASGFSKLAYPLEYHDSIKERHSPTCEESFNANTQNIGAPRLVALISPMFLLRLDFYVAKLTP